MGGSSLNTRSAMGRMSLTMMAAFAELERNLISERTSMALRHKRDQGKVYGSTPYGFQRNGDDLSPDATEAQTIALITKWRTTMSLRQIAYKLNLAEVPTKRGGRRWYASTVGGILANDLHG